MGKIGRKNVYDTKIKPRLDEISEWSKNGVTERSMAKTLGIAYSTFNKYKAEKTELAEILKEGREEAVEVIENALYKKATGFDYVEEKTIESDGEIIRTERTKKTALPDTTAAIYLLKHWGKNKGYTNDPITIELKKRELELKERIAEENNW